MVVKVECPDGIKTALDEVITKLGGFEKFLKPGDRVLIKPNFNTADRYPGSSSPDSVLALADLCHENGAAEVFVADASTLWADAMRVMWNLGIVQAASSRPWLNLVNLDDETTVRRDIAGGRYLRRVSVPDLLNRVNRIIFLCCLKTHKLARYTGAIKLSVGLMAKRERLALHVRHLQEKVAELASVFRPDFTIMDARECFITGGPFDGERRAPGLVLASTNRVALDVEGIKIIQSYPGNSLAGLEPEKLPQIARAMEMGLDRD